MSELVGRLVEDWTDSDRAKAAAARRANPHHHAALDAFAEAEAALKRSDYSGRTKAWSEGWAHLRKADPVFDRENRNSEKARDEYNGVVEEMRRKQVIEPKDFEEQFHMVRAALPEHAKRLDAASAKMNASHPDLQAALKRARDLTGKS